MTKANMQFNQFLIDWTIVFFSGLAFSKSKAHFGPSYSLWVPGQGCPVGRCGARMITLVSDFRRHWREKHEEIVAKYHCTACLYVSKRKSNLSNHFRKRHGHLAADSSVECVDRVEYHRNQEYIDPYPLSLQNAGKPGVWFPGGACPVLGCGAKTIRKACELKRHWREMHESIVAMYPCSVCGFFAKRRFDVVQHFLSCHGSLSFRNRIGKNHCVGNIMYHQNPSYINPHPLTLASVQGRRDSPSDNE
ncbi:hypothetical protein EGW08_018080 [Elysia chlorotica]|uniref:C2H2-type domain-containing protein n=1 Tax=Elysia chlorotica TaxID=188477 RepID=A0A3S0ZSG5_ELYCH|nr:hypothetical protein EGW08_018080 [Elysia chlorotica]